MRGTVQPCRTNPNEVQVGALTKLPNTPRWFSATQKRIYKAKGEQLRSLGVLTALDFELFISFCREYGNYIDTAKELEKIPLKAVLDERSEQVNKRMSRINKESWERSKSLAAEFGFSPSARAKFSAAESADPEEDNFS